MPSIDKIIALLNAYWTTALFSHARFANGLIGGLAHIVTASENENADTQFPVIYRDGEPFSVGLDDTFPLIVYHRQTGDARYEKIEAQFGDENDNLKRVVPMKMVVFGRRSILGLTPEELETMIILASPTNVSPSDLVGTNVDHAGIEIENSDLVDRNVFGEEYRGIEYPIGPDEFLFKIEYSLAMQFRKHCVNVCDCL